ncbi:glutathione S-transferase family protein [Anabaena cylindrica FACHB-243]|uniref:Glutathione S-transferase domain protein n=1 Tax=Anabaena cylindrica (strain ATCC 27899 / PCC 7122) TaxID=272123 RepID=K9ZIN8_ANACC|nr:MULTISPECIES: glutathione S-transferase family protein [Anabaena]AFZ58427.1 Glutathione S-transferase domain protein [Anabaena cylindrica PCC 7122]MBD2417022.1 glutathione S-transferase family protein [Anabaena cylindrica FACHB-243]MBY5280654.1 glutathione S-transferase family protein [Anabaena sp. CCAP 1446/1C]MBY5311643.1 glutathione S-transferase family protein [Anabaena sp. CCAP 1446/1C]MCM2406559.1 glutathione S-transferase family protein [Anabaena sp. CCAP 1446/1C]
MPQLTLVIGNKNYSSWSLRPWLVMKQFGLKFEEIRIPLYSSDSLSELQQYSSSGKVPVLLHNNITVWDSLAICEYLAETFPHLPCWPENTNARALARSISAEMHSGFQMLRQNMPMNCRNKYPGKGWDLGVQKDINRITSIWQECLQSFGANGKFLFGNFTIADAMFAPVVLRFLTYDVQIDSISRNYVEAILELPAIQDWITAAKGEFEVISKFEF